MLIIIIQGILERLAAGPIIGDGGFIFELEKRGYVKAWPQQKNLKSKFPIEIRFPIQIKKNEKNV